MDRLLRAAEEATSWWLTERDVGRWKKGQTAFGTSRGMWPLIRVALKEQEHLKLWGTAWPQRTPKWCHG